MLGGFRSGSDVAVALVLKGPLGPRLHLVNLLVNVLNVLLQDVLLVFILNRIQKVGVPVAAVSHFRGILVYQIELLGLIAPYLLGMLVRADSVHVP